jgi:hypothetical protein
MLNCRGFCAVVFALLQAALANPAHSAGVKRDCANPEIILRCVIVPWDKPVPETTVGDEGWQAPLPPAVQDGRSAITIAHAYWQSMHIQLNVGDESDWQNAFKASLVDGVWEVATKTWTDSHGAFVVYIRAQDGRLLSARYLN